MAGIFSDLSSIGFGGLSNVNIFDDEDEKKKSAKQQGATGTPVSYTHLTLPTMSCV